jgi:protein O-mannosyl-transferase
MRIRFQIMLLMAVVLGVYYPALSVPMNSLDDPGIFHFLLNNDRVNLWYLFFPGASGGYYRPLLQLSFLCDKYVWGFDESFLHLTNILLHLCNTLLVFLLARKVCRSNSWSFGGAFLAALLFAIHPLNSESICWISGRTDPLAGFFLLLSVWALLQRSRPVLSSFMAALCMLLGCLVKETAIFYLPAALIFPFYLTPAAEKDSALPVVARRNLFHFAVFLTAGAGYFLLRALAFTGGDEAASQAITRIIPIEHPDLLLRLRMVFKVMGFYGKKLFMPFPLNFAITKIPDAYLFLGLLVLAIVTYLAFRRSLVSFFWVCAAAIASSSLVIALLNTTWTPLAERYMYIPSAFFLIALVPALCQWEAIRLRRSLSVAAVVLLVAVAGYGTVIRNLLWQDNLALFQDAERQNPGFMPVRNEIATALKHQGKTREALEIYKSFEAQPELKNYQYGMLSKAGGYVDNGEFAKARTVLREVMKTPGKQEVLILEKMLETSKFEISSGKATPTAVYGDTVQCLSRLSQITGDPFFQYRLGVVHLQEKHDDLALASFRAVCKTAGPDVYYRKPAEKLVARLAAKPGTIALGGNQYP